MRYQGSYSRRPAQPRRINGGGSDWILPAIIGVLAIIVVVLAVLLIGSGSGWFASPTGTPYIPTPLPSDLTTPGPTDEPTATVPTGTDGPTAAPTATPSGKEGEVTIQMMGDILLHETTTLKAGLQADGTYDYSAFFREIDPYINGDLVLANADVLFDAYGDGSRYSSWPVFNSPSAILTALKNVGVTGMITGNNHAFDAGKQGLINSCNNIIAAGMDSIGACLTQEEHDNFGFIKEYNGIKIGILAYTDWMNDPQNTYSANKYMVKLVNHSNADRAMMINDIKALKARGAEFIIVSFHGGQEYTSEPASVVRATAQMLIDSGADIIMGTHPHTVHPVTYRTNTADGKTKKVVVAYSLGNFFADQRGLIPPTPRTEQGVILTVKIRRADDGSIVIDDCSYLPTYTLRRDYGTGNYFYQVLPAGKYALSQTRLPYLESDEEWQLLKDAWEQTTKTMGSAARAETGN